MPSENITDWEMKMPRINAKETFYKGYRFRSRLEARWAVFFDALGVKYEYEPQGFMLPSGKCYLPDFKIKCYGTRGDFCNTPFDLWIEVKGEMTQEDADKIHEFAGQIVYYDQWSMYKIENPVLVVGNIPDPYAYFDSMYNYKEMNGIRIYPWNYETIDGDYYAAYPAVKDGRFYLDGADYMTMNPYVIRDAFIKARQARFEHGETPTI